MLLDVETSVEYITDIYLKTLFCFIPSRCRLQLRASSLHASDNLKALMISCTSCLKMANHRWIQEET